MAPWVQSFLVYAFAGACLVGLLTWKRRTRVHARLGLGLALAAPFALQYAGPGAIAWSILGLLAGALLPFPRLSPTGSRLGRGLWLLHRISALALTSLFAVLLGQQGLSLLRDLVPDLRVSSGLLQGMLLLALALPFCAPKAMASKLTDKLVRIIAMAWAALCAIALFSQSAGEALQRIFKEAFQALGFASLPHAEGQTQLAALLCMVSTGVIASMWARPRQLETTQEKQRPKAAYDLVLTVLCVGLTGWMLVSAKQPLHERLDDPELRLALAPSLDPKADARATTKIAPDAPQTPARWLPLERTHAQSFAATSVGQSIVLPKDSPLSANQEYPLLFRANPRGSRIGKITPRGNGLFIPYPWRTLHQIKHIRFRDKDPNRAKSSAFDLRVPVSVRMLGSEHFPRGVVLVPKNPNLKLAKMIESMDGPFAELSDQKIVASPQRMHNSRIGVHDALLAYSSHPENSFGPSLRDLVGSLGFRGPYLSGTPDKHPPFAMVGKEGLNAAPLSQRELILKSPPRGLQIGHLSPTGALVTPPWKHLVASKSLVFRHKQSPHLDLVIPATSHLKSGRLHFYPNSSTFNDLRALAREPEYSGPFLMAPDYPFTVELHEGSRFPDPPGTPAIQRGLSTGALATRASLVPVHTIPEPIGAQTKLYDPHPAEFAFTDAQGPFVPASPAHWVLRSLGASSHALRWTGRGLLLLLLLCASHQLARSFAAQLGALLGQGSRILGPLALLALAGLGSFASWSALGPALMLTATLAFAARLAAAISGLTRKA